MCLIKAKNLIVKRDNKSILSNINFEIKIGSFVSILGKNGSGKTTLAFILSNILEDYEGEIELPSDFSLDSIGIVFQNPENQFLKQTVKENIAFALENKNIKREDIDKIIDESLKALNIFDLKEKESYMLSGGEKQKVAIAEQLSLNKKIIILDEPTSFLDPISKNEILVILQKLKEEGKTIIFISHELNDLLNSDQIIVLEKGNKIFDGSLNEFIKNDYSLDNFELEFSRKIKQLNNENEITPFLKEILLWKKLR